MIFEQFKKNIFFFADSALLPACHLNRQINSNQMGQQLFRFFTTFANGAG